MFNRVLQVKMVKNDKKKTATPEETDTKLTAIAAIGYHCERACVVAGKAIIGYVIVDTARQVLIAKALKP